MNDLEPNTITFEVEVTELINDGIPSVEGDDIEAWIREGLRRIGQFEIQSIKVKQL